MSKSDWIEVGLRLLGVFFIVTGLIALWRTTLLLTAAAGRGVGDASLGGIALLISPAEIVAGIVLLFIRWPQEVAGRRRSPGKPMPGYLEESFDQMERGSTGGRADPGAAADGGRAAGLP
jgi:hypothetical protein